MERIDEKNVQYYYLKDDGTFPNNARLPVLFYKGIIPKKFFEGPLEVKQLLKLNHWENAWADTVYDFHHYHSTAHEVLVCIEGHTQLQVGGDNGVTIHFEKGDALVIPAGVAHKNLDPDNIFKCVGAYPKGQNYDMNYGRLNEREKAERNIELVELPEADPLFGVEGPLTKYWIAVHQHNNA